DPVLWFVISTASPSQVFCWSWKLDTMACVHATTRKRKSRITWLISTPLRYSLTQRLTAKFPIDVGCSVRSPLFEPKSTGGFEFSWFSVEYPVAHTTGAYGGGPGGSGITLNRSSPPCSGAHMEYTSESPSASVAICSSVVV